LPQPTPWELHFFERHFGDDLTRAAPASHYLLSCPLTVRTRIFAVLNAVRAAPPPQFSGGGMWEAMHGEILGDHPKPTSEDRLKTGH